VLPFCGIGAAASKKPWAASPPRRLAASPKQKTKPSFNDCTMGSIVLVTYAHKFVPITPKKRMRKNLKQKLAAARG
jgi:hypothetical protein